MSDEPWLVRRAESQDLGLVYRMLYAGLASSLAGRILSWDMDDSLACKNMRRDHQALIYRLLERARVDLACDREEPDVIFAVAVTEPGLIHYFGVKKGMWPSAVELAHALLGELYAVTPRPRGTFHSRDLHKLAYEKRVSWMMPATDVTWFWREIPNGIEETGQDPTCSVA